MTINKPNYVDIIFYSLLLILCYFCFNQGDILHAGGSSFTYLNGHIKDFYEVNKTLMGGAAYLPSTYILFAIWNIPIKLLGIVSQATMNVGYVIFWYKLLTTIFLIASAYFLYKIGKIIGLGKGNAKLMTIIWVSSPILIFSQFIFGQYDIFTIFFVLAGLYYYLQKKTFLFILFFGISYTFKYFPLLMFIPLILLIEKNPLKLIGYIFMSLIPAGIEILFYSGSPAFVSGVWGSDALLFRINQASITIWPGIGIYLFLLIWFIICGICYYIAQSKDRNTFYERSFYICLAVCCPLFTLVQWYPQWLLFMTPFIAITTFMSRKTKFFLLLDFLMMISFVGFTVCTFQNNVDQQMLTLGILGKFNPNLTNPDIVLGMAQLFSFGVKPVGALRDIYLTLFCAIMVLNVYFKFPGKSNVWEGDNKLVPVQEYWNYARLRFFGGVAVFIIPAFIAYFVTLLARS
jgi:hypothetical protein